MLIPSGALRAAEREDSPPSVRLPSVRLPVVGKVVDVGLRPGGTLVGRAVDSSGAPLTGALVTVKRASGEVATATTDSDGRFAVVGLRGGVYQVVAGEGCRIARLWSPGTAPPSASSRLLVVRQTETLLGQREAGPLLSSWERVKHWLANPWFAGGLVAAAVAIPVIVHNVDVDNKDSGS
ncbi:MAG: carboxypeptidase-like regulatory domain-containing protein [Pirellulaceae bacterium]